MYYWSEDSDEYCIALYNQNIDGFSNASLH